MRKWLSILLLPIYCVLTIGLGVLNHKCGDEYSTDLYPLSTEDPCFNCAKHHPQTSISKRHCCTLEYSVYQLNVAQVQAAQQSGSIAVPEAALNGAEVHFSPMLEPLARLRSSNCSPPHAPQIYLLNCTFLV